MKKALLSRQLRAESASFWLRQGHFGSRWTCNPSPTRWRCYASSAAPPKAKPYYITTPIFYVNADPHVGHLYTLVLTDILKRWQVLKGREAILCTGTDEHGMKIQRAAASADSEPKPFCDKGAEVFKDLAKKAAITNDHFVRTTDPDHREAVEYIWHLLRERGYIYSSKHEGWYCVSDETFYPQSAVQLILDPRTGRKMMTSIETGKEVEWTSESNYHFRLSAFKDRLLDFYEKNPNFIIPQKRMNNVVQAVTSGLEDLSISRPSERLTWGIRVPGDSSQTIYVWLDALINYLTKSGFPWTPGKESIGGWPADCQVIGKDIVRFHCIYWPAFLLALDIEPPKQVLTHAHWTLGREKMAKSTGNVVNPFFALDRFGVDVMRYYLARDGGISNDSDYGNPYIIARYKKDLQAGLGNLSSRILRGKGWNVRRAVEAAHGNEIPPEDELSSTHGTLLETLADQVDGRFSDLDVGGALKSIIEVVYSTNRYLQSSTPWDLVKSESSLDKARIDVIIYHCAETLRICGILLQPYMPNKASELLDMLGVAAENRSFSSALFNGDSQYGNSKVDLGKGHRGTLFPPLDSDF
ncbi:MAG: Mevalonate kinase [Chaenotheca gracillima]|nr:MAG: Mevalonate kinase [Chaenotheca gracillima]